MGLLQEGAAAKIPLQMKLLRDVAIRHLLTVVPANKLRHVARLMTDRGVGSAVVMENGEVAGIVTERDLLHAAAAGQDFETTTVAEVMTTEVVSGDPGWDVIKAVKTMTEGGFRHLLVMDVDGPVGIVSLRDLMRTMADMLDRNP